MSKAITKLIPVLYAQSIGSIHAVLLAGNGELPGCPAVDVEASRKDDDDVGGPGMTEVEASSNVSSQIHHAV